MSHIRLVPAAYDSFADLDDTPSLVAGQYLRTNVGGTALEFTDNVVEKDGDTMTGALILRSTAQTSPGAGEAVPKEYVDGVAQGLDLKESVDAATTQDLETETTTAWIANDSTPSTGEMAYHTTNLTISWDTGEGPTVIDGVTLANDDRILVKDEDATSGPTGGDGRPYHGIYVRTSQDVWTRSEDADGTPAGEVSAGLFTFVAEGTTQADTGWVLTTNDPITLDTTNLIFSQFSGAGSYTEGTAINISGTVISVDLGTSGTQAAYGNHNHDSAYISIIGSPTTDGIPTITAGGELANSSTKLADLVAVAGDTMTGTLLLDLGSNVEGIRIQGDASQADDLQTWETSAAALLAAVTSAGVVEAKSFADVDDADAFLSWGSGTPEASVTAGPGALYGDVTNGAFYVKASGTGNTGWVVAGTPTDYVHDTGDTMTGQLFIDGGTDEIQLRIQGEGSQTADLQVWEQANTTVLATVTATGVMEATAFADVDDTDASLQWGSNTPESSVTAGPGSIYGDVVGGELYYKDSGTGNTGWLLVGDNTHNHDADYVDIDGDTMTSTLSIAPSSDVEGLTIEGANAGSSDLILVTDYGQANELFKVDASGYVYAERFADITDADAFIEWGAGTPESSVTAGPGAIYGDVSNGNMYVKNSGTSNTGWLVLFTTANDGTGTGLDADKLDGQEGAYYAIDGHNHDASYISLVPSGITGNLAKIDANDELEDAGVAPLADGVTTNHTLYWNGSAWIATGLVFADVSNSEVGINTASPNSTLHLNGTLATKLTTVTSTTTVGDHQVILCNNTSGSIDLDLPAVSGLAGRTYQIKKIGAAANDVVIDPNSAEEIDGETSFTLTNQYEAVTIVCDGSAWFIL